MIRLRSILIIVAFLLQAGSLLAATVAIVQPAQSTPDMASTLSRLHGELSSIGLVVIPGDAVPGDLPSPEDVEADAVVAMAEEKDVRAVEVWFAKPPTGQPKRARITVDAETQNPAETLALRTVELLRANLIAVEWAGRATPLPAPPPIVPPVVPKPETEAKAAPASPPVQLGLGVGAAVLTSLDGIGPALLPTVNVAVALRPSFIFQVVLAGFGTQPTLASERGSARVAQHYGVLGAAYRFRTGSGPLPFVSFAGGALRTSVVGHAISSMVEAERGSQWSFLVDGGVGIELPLWGSLHAAFGAHVQVAMPHVAVHFMDVAAATTGRPNLLFDLTVGLWR